MRHTLALQYSRRERLVFWLTGRWPVVVVERRLAAVALDEQELREKITAEHRAQTRLRNGEFLIRGEGTQAVYRDGTLLLHLPGPNPGTPYTACGLDAGVMIHEYRDLERAGIWCTDCLQVLSGRTT